jgi:hypothetical protein
VGALCEKLPFARNGAALGAALYLAQSFEQRTGLKPAIEPRGRPTGFTAVGGVNRVVIPSTSIVQVTHDGTSFDLPVTPVVDPAV